jgi:transcriptional regulator with XRE-family HTH domain
MKDEHATTTRLGRRIRYERQSKGWTQAQLATASGLQAEDIARFERGEDAPSVDAAQRIAAALGVTVRYLTHSVLESPNVTKRGVG